MRYSEGSVVHVHEPATPNGRCMALVKLHQNRGYEPCNARPSWYRAGYFVCPSHARANVLTVPYPPRQP